jgi:hypothetical protein
MSPTSLPNSYRASTDILRQKQKPLILFSSMEGDHGKGLFGAFRVSLWRSHDIQVEDRTAVQHVGPSIPVYLRVPRGRQSAR